MFGVNKFYCLTWTYLYNIFLSKQVYFAYDKKCILRSKTIHVERRILRK